MNIQHKILFGYVILMAVIGSMTAILLFDRARIREIEEESAEIRSVRRDINTVHRRITELATLGESVMAWDTTEYHLYHEKRISVDTLLADLKQNCTGFVLPEQVDTLRMLLSDKEHHLYRIMKAFHRQEIADSLIAEQLPKVTSGNSRQPHSGAVAESDITGHPYQNGYPEEERHRRMVRQEGHGNNSSSRRTPSFPERAAHIPAGEAYPRP